MKTLLLKLKDWFLATKFFAFLKKTKEFLVAVWNDVVLAWRWLVTFCTTEEFVLIFPLAVFALTALLVHSFLFTLASFLWLIPVVDGLTKKE